MSNLLIIGAGGHGKVVADTAYQQNRWHKISFLDDSHPQGSCVLDFEVLGAVREANQYINEYSHFVVAVGNNAVRMKLQQELSLLGFSLTSLFHPLSYVSPYAQIGEGTVVCAQAVVQPGAVLGQGCIVNTTSSIDHDCLLADGVHISPGARLAGQVTVGTCSWIGIGASVIQQIKIGDHVTVGAGAVVIRDVDSCSKVVGVPARSITREKESN